LQALLTTQQHTSPSEEDNTILLSFLETTRPLRDACQHYKTSKDVAALIRSGQLKEVPRGQYACATELEKEFTQNYAVIKFVSAVVQAGSFAIHRHAAEHSLGTDIQQRVAWFVNRASFVDNKDLASTLISLVIALHGPPQFLPEKAKLLRRMIGKPPEEEDIRPPY
jgi:hypothetical protein